MVRSQDVGIVIELSSQYKKSKIPKKRETEFPMRCKKDKKKNKHITGLQV